MTPKKCKLKPKLTFFVLVKCLVWRLQCTDFFILFVLPMKMKNLPAKVNRAYKPTVYKTGVQVVNNTQTRYFNDV